MANGHIPNFIAPLALGGLAKLLGGANVAKNVASLGSAVASLGKTSLKAGSAIKTGATKAFKSPLDAIGKLTIATFALETGMSIITGFAELFVDDVSSLEKISISGAVQAIRDNIKEIDRTLIESSERYVAATEKQVNLIQQNIEKIGQILVNISSFK